MGTILSAPVVTIAAVNEECQDNVPASFSSFVGHMIDWTSRIGPLGYGVAYMTSFLNKKEEIDEKIEDEPKD